VREQEDGVQPVRLGHCANHAAIPAVGSCDVCRKAICLSCAVPVRGRLVCHECLGTVLDDVSIAPRPPELRGLPVRGDGLAITGFALVVVLSVFPWTHFGDDSGYLEAWSLQWSLVAVAGSAMGLAFAVWALRRPTDPRLAAAVYAGMGLVVGVASILYHQHPPGSPLASAAATSRLALVGALLALVGGLVKRASTLRWGRPAP
jgi:hypothetical protein